MNTFYITLSHFSIQTFLWYHITNSFPASVVYAGLSAGLALLIGSAMAYGDETK
jgi:hypothetical protein